MKIQRRQYQKDAVSDIRRAFASGKKGVMYRLDTGGGKSLIFGEIAEGVSFKGKRALILVHRQELLYQASKMLDIEGIYHSKLLGKKFKTDWHAPILVASIQSVIRNLNLMPHYDLIICDEAHLSLASSYLRLFDHYKDSFLLGVTATPKRLDKRSFNPHYETLIQGPPMAWLIEQGFLSNYVAYAPKGTIPLDEVRTRMGDYDEKQLEDIMSDKKIVGDAVEHYRKYSHNLPAIAFCCSIRHAESIALAFRGAGYNATHIDGKMSDDRRRYILNGLANGTYHVVTSCSLISEGLDIPCVTTAILMRPTQSVALAMQQMGRALRVHPQKQYAIILDHAMIIKTHGLPDEEREWTLDAEKKKAKKQTAGEAAIKLSHCPTCMAIHQPAIQCPRCGHMYESKTRDIEEVDGELIQVDKDAAKRAAEEQKRNARVEVGKARTLEQLIKVAEQRGYKKSWAYHVYNSRQKKG